MIDQMVLAGKNTETNQYIKELIGGSEKKTISVYTNHKMVDLILATKEKEAETRQIRFQCEKGWISLKFRRREKMLVIVSENSIMDQIVLNEDTKLLTSKKKRKYHEYGLKSIRQILNQYDGYMEFNEGGKK